MSAMPSQAELSGSGGQTETVGQTEATSVDSLLVKERDLYSGLLALSTLNEPGDPEEFLKRALELIVGIAGADHGYIELFDPDGIESSWTCAAGLPADQVDAVKVLISRGVIGEAVATARTVVTPSALLDPRFRDRASVQRSGIDAVLCAPIGADAPQGVLYLGTSRAAQVFSNDHVGLVSAFCSHLAPISRQLLERRQSARDTSTDVRKKLRAEGYIGRSAALTRVLQEVHGIAPLDIGVLLLGETGTGKTDLARLIHANGPRAERPFVEVSCGTLQDNLVENELFGSAQGAHSTATRPVEGKVAAARNGTLFLDEIEALSPTAQAKLLQFLQSKEYFPLGAARPVRADVRIIAASNRDLQQLVNEKSFREDLFYRLQVVTVRLPTLAERVDDIGPLARHFCAQACERYKLPEIRLSQAAIRVLETTEWPGNVRQLAHAIESATARAAVLRLGHVEVSHLFQGASTTLPPPSVSLTFQAETRRFHAQLLQRVLQAEDWNVTAAARRLEITRSHLYTLIRSFGLSR